MTHKMAKNTTNQRHKDQPGHPDVIGPLKAGQDRTGRVEEDGWPESTANIWVKALDFLAPLYHVPEETDCARVQGRDESPD